jgi:hypothetical protein
MNISIPSIRNGPQIDFPSNNNGLNMMNPAVNLNRGPTLIPPAQSGSPFAPPTQDPGSRGPFTPLPTPTNNPQTSLSGFPPGMNLNQSAPVPPANNAPPALGGFPPGMNLDQSRPPPAANVQPSAPSGFSPGMNTNPPAAVPGFLLGMNRNPSAAPQMSPMSGPNNQPNTGSQTNMPSQNASNDDDNVSRLELDYPIENVLIDANIPSAVAVKVNQAVERDRLGNAFHVHRYAVEPTSQQLSFGDGQQMPSRPLRHSQQSGTRHIREIYNDHHDAPFDHSRHGHGRHRDHRHQSDAHINDYVDRLIHTPGSIVIQADNLNNLQQLLGQHQPNVPHLAPHASTGLFQTSAASFPEPIHYYTARALPNDPMRSY